MPRTYSQEFINQVKQQDPNESGIALAQACVGANLPAKYVKQCHGECTFPRRLNLLTNHLLYVCFSF